jgi:hypothetical protein
VVRDAEQANREEEIMKKLAIIGAVIAGLVAPTTSAVAGPSRHHLRPCCTEPIFRLGKNVSLRGPLVFKNTVTVWVRDPVSGRVTPIPYGKWRTEDGR